MGDSTARASRGAMSKKGQKNEIPMTSGRSTTAATAKTQADAPSSVADTLVDGPQDSQQDPGPVRVAKGKSKGPSSRLSVPPPSKAKRLSKPPAEAPIPSVPAAS